MVYVKYCTYKKKKEINKCEKEPGNLFLSTFQKDLGSTWSTVGRRHVSTSCFRKLKMSHAQPLSEHLPAVTVQMLSGYSKRGQGQWDWAGVSYLSQKLLIWMHNSTCITTVTRVPYVNNSFPNAVLKGCE